MDVILTGLPRSGTTLTCHLLNKLPDTVALNEPMDVSGFGTLGGHAAVCDAIADYLAETRAAILATGKAASGHVGGQVPDNFFEQTREGGGLRRKILQRGEIDVAKPLKDDFLLCIKHNAAFAAVLPELKTRFPAFALVRNPLAALASWSSVDIPVQSGRLPAGEALDAKLAAALASEPEVMARQMLILDWFFRCYRDALRSEAILRYEDIVSSGGTVLSCVTAAASGLREPLREKNANTLYRPEAVRGLAERLLAGEGAYWDFYSRDDVRKLRDVILA